MVTKKKEQSGFWFHVAENSQEINAGDPIALTAIKTVVKAPNFAAGFAVALESGKPGDIIEAGTYLECYCRGGKFNG